MLFVKISSFVKIRTWFSEREKDFALLFSIDAHCRSTIFKWKTFVYLLLSVTVRTETMKNHKIHKKKGFYGFSILTWKDIVWENADAEPHFSALTLREETWWPNQIPLGFWSSSKFKLDKAKFVHIMKLTQWMKLIQGSKNNIKMTTSTIFLVFPLLNLNKFYRFLQQAPKSQDPSCLKLYENVFVYFESADFMKIL